MQDRYGNTLSTTSAAARDAYVEAVDLFLSAQAGVDTAFERAIAADPGFALAHVSLARFRQASGDGRGAKAAMAPVASLQAGLTGREAAHVDAFSKLIGGDGPGAYAAIRSHLLEFPRDAMIAQTCMGVFGMIGFSGQHGREAEQLAFTTSLAPHYGDDWWFLCQHAFAKVEAGQTAPAMAMIQKSFALNQKNANAAHIHAHVQYEAGETKAGYAFVDEWRKSYGKGGMLHCHISWHVALWALEHGDEAKMWQVLDTDVAPGTTWGPALNVITDTASLLYRAKVAGVDIPTARWVDLSKFAQKIFPKPGIAFGDAHAAIAHAFAGETDALNRLKTDAAGPAGDLVRRLAEAFEAIAAERWDDAILHLTPAMAEHERLGGSRAQRDLLEYAYLNALLKQGAVTEAQRLLALRRPAKVQADAIAGLRQTH